MHPLPTGALRKNPVLQNSLYSGQAGLAAGPDGIETLQGTQFMDMLSKTLTLTLGQNQFSLNCSSTVQASDLLSFSQSAWDVLLLDKQEDSEVCEQEDQPDPDSLDSDNIIVRIKITGRLSRV